MGARDVPSESRSEPWLWWLKVWDNKNTVFSTQSKFENIFPAWSRTLFAFSILWHQLVVIYYSYPAPEAKQTDAPCTSLSISITYSSQLHSIIHFCHGSVWKTITELLFRAKTTEKRRKVSVIVMRASGGRIVTILIISITSSYLWRWFCTFRQCRREQDVKGSSPYLCHLRHVFFISFKAVAKILARYWKQDSLQNCYEFVFNKSVPLSDNGDAHAQFSTFDELLSQRRPELNMIFIKW